MFHNRHAYYFILGVFLILLPFGAFSQNREELEKKKQKTQKEIEYTSKLLNQTRKGAKKSYNDLLLLNKKITSRKELIINIGRELKLLDKHIKENQDIINALQNDLEELKKKYARMIQYARRNKNTQQRLMFILSSEDFNQAYKRIRYLQQYAEYREQQAAAIVSMQKVIEDQTEALESRKQEKEQLLTSKEKERLKLNSEKEEQSTILQNLQSKEKELKRKLAAKRKQARQLEEEIERLIALEAKKSSGNVYVLTPEEKIISTNFGNNKGRLPWPVSRGVITRQFGTHPHPVLKNIQTNNNGIDISTSEGARVRSIFDGNVRKIFQIPGAQNAIIIRHGNYLSVYTHLAKVFVSEGEQVSTKQHIGELFTDKSENQTIVHIEIWYGNKKMNPENWLAK